MVRPVNSTTYDFQANHVVLVPVSAKDLRKYHITYYSMEI